MLCKSFKTIINSNFIFKNNENPTTKKDYKNNIYILFQFLTTTVATMIHSVAIICNR
jgi:hypothetical protein